MQYKTKHEAKEWSMATFKNGPLISTIPTTFTPDAEDVDLDGVKQLVRHSITECKADGMFVIGNVGEFFSMTIDERKATAQAVCDEANGEVPIIVQTATHCAKDCVDLSLHAQDAGADLVAILTPYFQANTEQAIWEWFKYVTDRIDIGIVLYNSPLCTPLTPEFVGKITTEMPNFVGVKEGYINTHTAKAMEKAADYKIWVSDPDERHWVEELFCMRNPVMCCNWIVYFFQKAGYWPVKDYTKLALEGKWDEARKIFDDLQPVRDILTEVFFTAYAKGVYTIGMFKYWLELLGQPGGPVRAPLVNATEEEKTWLRTNLEKVGAI